MEPRLINVNNLERYKVEKEKGHWYVPWVAIAEVPTAEAERQKRGEWIDQRDYLGSKSGYKFCSLCKGWMPICSRDYPYCPNCGARMDGD